jgi:hypothetical protein
LCIDLNEVRTEAMLRSGARTYQSEETVSAKAMRCRHALLCLKNTCLHGKAEQTRPRESEKILKI